MDDFYFDDCPICRALKKAEEENRSLTLEEYMRAAREAEASGGIVGGEML